MEKWVFVYTNFEVFLWNFSSSTNSKIVKSFVFQMVVVLNISIFKYKPKCIQADFEYCKQIFLCGAIYWTGKEHTHTQNWERISFFKKLFAACAAAAAIINIFYFWIVYWSNKNCNSPNFLQAEKFSSKDICQGLIAKWVPNRNIRFSVNRISQ